MYHLYMEYSVQILQNCTSIMISTWDFNTVDTSASTAHSPCCQLQQNSSTRRPRWGHQVRLPGEAAWTFWLPSCLSFRHNPQQVPPQNGPLSPPLPGGPSHLPPVVTCYLWRALCSTEHTALWLLCLRPVRHTPDWPTAAGKGSLSSRPPSPCPNRHRREERSFNPPAPRGPGHRVGPFAKAPFALWGP